MKLTYTVEDKPEFSKILMFALQQLLAILAATIAVPSIIGNGMSQSAALFGAGVGTIVYLLFTKFKSPVFLGSSFAFLGSMAAAFGGAITTAGGYAGLIIGAAMAGLVYVVIAILVKIFGVSWINKLMPAVVIGPTVAIIGLSLAGNAVGDLFTGNMAHTEQVWQLVEQNGTMVAQQVETSVQNASPYACIICGLLTLGITMYYAVYGKRMNKMIPFILGIRDGYTVAAVLTGIGIACNLPALQIVDFSKFAHMQWVPDFTFMQAIKGVTEVTPRYVLALAVAYVPVAFVVFAEHIADHKNISSIIERDLLEEPGLHRTLLGDGIGSMAGAFFGGCPNTTYGESIGCVAISGNASVVTILATALLAIVCSFIAPLTTLLATIPSCVMGGVCIALYGFIAVSGLKMIQSVDLNTNNNLFVVSVILITGVGGMTVSFGQVTLTEVACALILGVLANLLLHSKRLANNSKDFDGEPEDMTAPVATVISAEDAPEK